MQSSILVLRSTDDCNNQNNPFYDMFYLVDLGPINNFQKTAKVSHILTQINQERKTRW